MTCRAVPAKGARVSGSREMVLLPPAQLTVKMPSASESIFSIRRPFSGLTSSEPAPSRPISSSTVKTASSRGGQIIGIQDGQGHGHGNAVVTAQSGTSGTDEITVHLQVKTFLGHVLGTIRLLLTDHVQMSLEDHGFRLLIAGRGFLDDDDVIVAVLMVFQTSCPGKVGAPVAHGLGVAGAAGNGGHLLKKMEYTLGFQIFQYLHIE